MTRLPSSVFALGLVASACHGKLGDLAGGTEVTPPETPSLTPPIPWEPLGPETYVPKIKRLLTGLHATTEEIDLGGRDRRSLAVLVDSWMHTPEFDRTMLRFFRDAFQQGQLKRGDLDDQFGYFGGLSSLDQPSVVEARIYRDVQDVFPRTALEIVKQGRPFTETMTTRGFMMTVPLMALFLHGDGVSVPDESDDIGAANVRFFFHEENPDFTFSIANAGGPISLDATLDPGSDSFMTWYAPQHDLSSPVEPACRLDPRVYPGGYDGPYRTSEFLLNFLFGRVAPVAVDGVPDCGIMIGAPIFTEADFVTWRWVETKPSEAGEGTTPFYDVVALRAATEIRMRTPRIGLFSTHAFFANWPTNTSNLARVTANQALIVALGRSFDGTGSTVPVSESLVDGEHAAPNTACHGCHQTLDPMRQYFRQAYSLHYHEQRDPVEAATPGGFAFDGVTFEGGGIDRFAALLADHPRFALAWAQKLCVFARSVTCSESDPELVRVADAFRESGHDFLTLVRETMTSPLVTEAAPTETFDASGVYTPIALRDQVCRGLSERLDLDDPCGTQSLEPTESARRARSVVEAIPDAGYSRGAEYPALALDPSLFLRAGEEALCREVSLRVVDGEPAETRYSSLDAETALDDMVERVMGVDRSDARAESALTVLREHFDVVAASYGELEALRSTFVLSCLSPSFTGMGL